MLQVVLRGFQGYWKKFQKSFKDVSRVFKGRLKGASMELKVGFNGVKRVFKEVSKKFQGCFNCVSRKF